MDKLYLLPIVSYIGEWGTARYPKYIACDFDQTGLTYPVAMMDYGFFAYGLVLIKGISQADHDVLILNADVYNFPDDLSGPVDDQDIDTFFEGINIPTDWLTPSTTWLELLRQLAGMFQFNQRYGGIAADETGELHSIFDNADLDTRVSNMTDDEQRWLQETVDHFTAMFELNPITIPSNSRLRQLVKQAGDFWAGVPFYLGGYTF